jgi:Putative peptidoglycan binding domain
MLPTVIKTATAAVTALSLSLTSASPALAWGKGEQNFLKGVAATLIVGAIINDARHRARPAPVYQQPVYPQPIPVHGGGYAVPLYQTPAAIAFNSYGPQERRAIQIRLANAGYYRSGIDGSFGPGTYNAVVAYARDTGNATQLRTRAGAFGVYDQLIY